MLRMPSNAYYYNDPKEDPREGMDPEELAEYERMEAEYKENADYEDMAARKAEARNGAWY